MAEPLELVRFFQGWVEVLEKDAKGKTSSENIWMVLKGDHVFLFTHQTLRTEDTIKAFFPINVKSSFDRKSKDDKKHGGYVFEIHTVKDGKKYNTKFKIDKKSDLETLRGFIYGLSKGKLPKDLDLPRSVQDDMVNTLHIHQQSKRGNDPRQRISRLQSEPHINVNLAAGGNSYLRRQSLPNILKNQTVKEEANDDILQKPYFFAECTRDKAMEIFRTAGCRYGNTLLRGNTTSSSDDHYAITYCTNLGRNREPVFTHFQVQKDGTGYRIIIEECEGQIIPCLADVMEVFVEVNGSERTYPMTCNDLTKLMTPENDDTYAKHIPSREEIFNAFGVRLFPGAGGSPEMLEEPKADYDDDYTTPTPSPTRTTFENNATTTEPTTQHDQMMAELTIKNLRSSIPLETAPPPPHPPPPPPPPPLPK